MYSIVTFYRFFPLKDQGTAAHEELCETMDSFADSRSIVGSMSFSPEGVNATIAGSREALESFLSELERTGQTTIENAKWSTTDIQPFKKRRFYLKDRLLGLRDDTADPTECVGTYVEPEAWNGLIEQEDVKVIDVRNWYETYVGTFEGALDPKTETFAEFDTYVDENLDPGKDRVAMFCTGGIRCEVATSLLLKRGFSEVYHLNGGILNYLEKVPPEASKWQGECFVFDERVSLDHDLKAGEFQRCRGCSAVLSAEDRMRPEYEEGVKCHFCEGQRSEAQLAASRERVKQRALEKRRREKNQQAERKTA